MKVFITGGSGFIGKWLVPLLARRGHELLVLSREPPEEATSSPDPIGYLRGDLKSPRELGTAMKDFGAEALIHLAWEGLPRYTRPLALLNLQNSLNLFHQALEAGCKAILSTGSCWEYASRRGKLGEDAPVGSTSTFPAVKTGVRMIGEAMAGEVGARFHWLRLFFVYGPGQRGGSLIPHILNVLESGEPLRLRSPDNANDFIYVEDVADAVAAVLEARPPSAVYNVGTGRSTPVREVAEIVCRTMVKPFDGDSLPSHREAPLEDFCADISRIQRDLGWSPRFTLEQGIVETVNDRKRSMR